MKNKPTIKIDYVPSGSPEVDFWRYIDSLGPVSEEELFAEEKYQDVILSTKLEKE